MKEMADDILSKMAYVPAGKNDTLYRRPYINKAEIALEVLNYYDGSHELTRDDWAQPAANMLLIKESSVSRFFTKRELPSDTCAILASVASEKVEGTDSIRYYYSYDIAALLTEEIRKNEVDTLQISDSLHLVLMPVSVGKTTNSYYGTTISSVKQEQIVSATEILSASNSKQPLSLEVVYSGF